MTRFPLSPTLTEDLRQIEQIVIERTRSRAAVISVAGTRLLEPGSERVRAALVLLAAQSGDYQRERVQHAAAAAELIYAATQTHDKLVDAAERRRGRPRDGEWNHAVALMVGDYLFALAAGEMALSPDPRVISFYSQAVMRITEATLEPLPGLLPLEQARARHLARINGTHGALFGAACRAGAACANATGDLIEILGRFGELLGLILQLGDEIYDFASADGASLRAGLLSLPLIYAATHGDSTRLVTALDSSEPAEQVWAIAEVRRHGLAPTRAEVAYLADQARNTLSGVAAGEAQAALGRVVAYAEQHASEA